MVLTTDETLVKEVTVGETFYRSDHEIICYFNSIAKSSIV